MSVQVVSAGRYWLVRGERTLISRHPSKREAIGHALEWLRARGGGDLVVRERR